MKKYIDYHNAITADELYNGLVGFGLFAEKISDFVTSEDFLTFSKTGLMKWDSQPRDYIKYQSMRNTNIPRLLAIPEPFAYATQCKALSDNWSQIKDHFESMTAADKFKISRIHIRKLINKKRLFEMNYKNFTKDGDPTDDIRISSKFIAYADIANCFPSIYSHSIPWALVGKEHAKNNRQDRRYFNKLDKVTRNLKDGETNGLLIGPHSSNLISEIVLTKIDSILSNAGFVFIRNIDDYTCYVDSYDRAEAFLIKLSEELRNFELLLNSKKSRIIHLPEADARNWRTKLNHFSFVKCYKVGDDEFVKASELKSFMEFALEVMLNENSDASILNYAIKIVAEKKLSVNAKVYYFKMIHHLVLLYPYLSQILDEFVFSVHRYSNTDLCKISEDLYVYGTSKKMFEASSYAVFWALKYNYKLEINEHTIRDDAFNSNDTVFILLTYLYLKRYDLPLSTEYVDFAKRLAINDFDKYWLFIYEVLDAVDLPREFKTLKVQNISFLKPIYR